MLYLIMMMKWQRIESSEHEEFYNWLRAHKLSTCHAKWNGNGEDVLHQAWELAVARGYFFDTMLAEAARKLRVHETQPDSVGNYCIQTPRTEKTQTRAAKHFAVAAVTDDTLQEQTDKQSLRERKKTKLIEKIKEMKNDELIKNCLQKISKRKKLTTEEIAQIRKKLNIYEQVQLFSVHDSIHKEV